MRLHAQLPGLGSAIARIVGMVDSTAESIQELRNIILADVHLTQRIIGIANSVGYRLNSSANVTTVSRAIVVIGFEQVKLVALGMVFVDELPDKERATALKAELILALQASLLAREMGRQLAPEEREQVAIAALLGNVAKLVLVLIDFERFREIVRRVANGSTEEVAVHEVLGTSLKYLTNGILSLWGIPEVLVSLCTATLAPMDSRHTRRLDRIVSLAKATALHLSCPDVAARATLIAGVRSQCIADGGVTNLAFDRWVSAADTQIAPMRAMLESSNPRPIADDGFPQGSVIDDAAPLTGIVNALGRPANCQDLVLARLQDLTQMIGERQPLSTILLTALECLHTGFGYARSVLLLRDAGTLKMRARVWCGTISKVQAGQLEIDIDSPGDMFAAAIRRGSDLQIRDALSPPAARRLPQYFTTACPRTGSFILLPIVSEKSPIACMLLGRDMAEVDPISSEDMRLLRTVRAQIVLAMKTAR